MEIILMGLAVLFLVCILGLGLLGLFFKRISALNLLIAPSLSLILFTHLTLIFSLILGVGVVSIGISFISAVIISIFSYKTYKVEVFWTRPNFLFFSIGFLAFSVFAYILFNQVLSPLENGLYAGGGGMYGDTALHAAYTSRMETGEFPPQNPLFAGKTLVYPLANDLLSASLKITGLNLNFSFVLPQLVFFAGFITLFYKVARKFTSDLGFIFAIILLFLGWGLGFIFFIKEWLATNIAFWDFLSRDYTHNIDYNLYFHNLLTGLILPERTILPGLILGLLGFLNFFEYEKTGDKKYLFLNGIILGILPFWHTHTFIFFSIFTFIFFLIRLLQGRFKKEFLNVLFSFLIAFAFAFPFIYLFLSEKKIGGFIHLINGWQNFQENPISFWFKNSFLTIPLATAGIFVLEKNLRVYFYGAFITFFIANFISFQPWDWDNIKLLSWSFLFFSILCGYLLSVVFKKNLIMKLMVVAIVIISCLSGFLSVLYQMKGHYILYDREDIELANWAKKNTDVNSVFLINPIPNHPIPGLSGRVVYVGYPGHLWVHGIDYQRREILSKSVLSGNLRLASEAEIPVDYIVTGKNGLGMEFFNNAAFQNEKYTVLYVE